MFKETDDTKASAYLEKREVYSYPKSDWHYSPHTQYPEHPFEADTLSPEPNKIYDMVRSVLIGLGLNKERFGTKEWNLLGAYVKPASKILIKPNWVKHVNNNMAAFIRCPPPPATYLAERRYWFLSGTGRRLRCAA